MKTLALILLLAVLVPGRAVAANYLGGVPSTNATALAAPGTNKFLLGDGQYTWGISYDLLRSVLSTNLELRWNSTGGQFKLATNTASLPVVVVTYTDASGVILSNVVYMTNGIAWFPNGIAATNIDVGVQTVTTFIIGGGQSNGVAILDSTGKVSAVSGVAGAPLVATTTTPLFSNGVAVATMTGTGTGTGITSPTNWYFAWSFSTNAFAPLTSNNKTNQIDPVSPFSYLRQFTNQFGLTTNVFLQYTNMDKIEGATVTVRIPGATVTASNYTVTILAPAGYAVDYIVATNGNYDYLVNSNKVLFVSARKWPGTNLLEVAARPKP